MEFLQFGASSGGVVVSMLSESDVQGPLSNGFCSRMHAVTSLLHTPPPATDGAAGARSFTCPVPAVIKPLRRPLALNCPSPVPVPALLSDSVHHSCAAVLNGVTASGQGLGRLGGLVAGLL